MKLIHIIPLICIFTILTNCGKDDDGLEASCTPETINYILNSSFEFSEPGLSTVPEGWENCGDTLQSPTDLFQNDLENVFSVTNTAEDGEQYVGMVVRPNGTIECLSQILTTPLQTGAYQIFISYAKPINYTSLSLINSQAEEANFNNPVTLEIIGIHNNEEQILFTTQPNETTSWTQPTITINITEPIDEIKLRTDFIGDEFYAGGILIDYFWIERI